MVSGVGPCLVATTSELFEYEACAELKAASRLLEGNLEGDLEARAQVAAPGLILVTLPGADLALPFQRALATLRPIFIRHIHRIDCAFQVAGLPPEELREQTIKKVQGLLTEAGVSPERTTFQVRKVMSEAAVTGGQIAMWLRSLAEENVHHGENSDQILSCTVLGADIYLGLGDARTNLSHRMGGAVHYDMSRFPVSRAGAKLAEAFEAFPLTQISQPARAIDLGAAPGGWTAVLVEHGFRVDAIDPGELHPSVASHPQVTSHRVKAQDWRPQMGGYDLLTCDVNWSAKETALAVVDLARHLVVGGFGVVTIKLNKGPAMPQIEAVKTILASRFRMEAVRLLFHNRREVTLFLRRL